MLNTFTFHQLVDLTQIRQLLESCHNLSEMSYGFLDTDENTLIAVGWQEICVRFHRGHPLSCVRCRESDAFIKKHLHDSKGEPLEYRCKNGLIDVAIPLVIEERHIATLFTGQFFYEDDRPAPEFFLKQAEALGFDLEEYLEAVERVPVFSRDSIRGNVLFLHNMVQVMAEMGLNNLRLAREVAARKRAEKRLARDITERKRLEDALCENNLFLNSLLEAIPLPIFYKGGDGRYLDVNRAFVEFFGRNKEDLIGKKVSVIASDELAGIYRRADEALFRTGGTQVYETDVLDANGVNHSVVFHKAVYTDKTGSVSGLIGVVLDITERKRMEQELRSSEQQFRTLAENSPDIIIRYDRDCRRLYVNPTFEREFEIPARDVLHVVPGADRWRIYLLPEEYLARLRQVMATGVPAEITLEWPRLETGRVVSHAIQVVAERNLEGEIIGCLAIGHNITALKEAELRLTKLAAGVPGFLFIYRLRPDGTACLPYSSPQIKDIYGFSPEAVTEDASETFARIHPDDVPRVRESIEESARTLSLWQAEYRIRHPEKGDIWVEGRSLPESQPDGGVVWFGFVHDITERKRVEKSLRMKREQLAAMAVELSLAEDRGRRRIASELHDHIGQTLLLARIKLGTLAEAVESDCDRTTYEEIRSLLDRTIRDVRSLTQQLHPPLLASVGLEAALDWLARRMATDYSLQVAFLDDRAAKPLTEELATVVYQSARELLINVAKHAGTGEAQLTIGREGNMYVLTVRDQGVGFTCIPDICTTMVPDCSFGLFNIRQRIKLLGGEVVIESVSGQGTCATIRVPLALLM